MPARIRAWLMVGGGWLQSFVQVATVAAAVDAAADLSAFASAKQTGRARAPEVLYQSFVRAC
jgi:hypothetical protein